MVTSKILIEQMDSTARPATAYHLIKEYHMAVQALVTLGILYLKAHAAQFANGILWNAYQNLGEIKIIFLRVAHYATQSLITKFKMKMQIVLPIIIEKSGNWNNIIT